MPRLPIAPMAPGNQPGLLVDDASTREEAWRRINSRPGFLSTLSPEALEYIKNYDGPENFGPPHPGGGSPMGKTHIPFEPVVPATRPKRGIRARLVEWLVDDAPPREEVRRRIRSKPSFWATLSPEARAAVLSYDGPENMGPPHPKR